MDPLNKGLTVQESAALCRRWRLTGTVMKERSLMNKAEALERQWLGWGTYARDNFWPSPIEIRVYERAVNGRWYEGLLFSLLRPVCGLLAN